MGKRGKRPPRPPKHIREMTKRKRTEEALKAQLEESNKNSVLASAGHKYYVSKGVQTEDSRISDVAVKVRLIEHVEDKENNEMEGEDGSKMDIDDAKASFHDMESMSGMEEYMDSCVFKQCNEDQSLV